MNPEDPNRQHTDEFVKDRDRYLRACHAMQTGVALTLQMDPTSAEPKHLRVGVNSAMVEHGALVQLLVDRGLIDEDQYMASLAHFMELEVASYQDRLPDGIRLV